MKIESWQCSHMECMPISGTSSVMGWVHCGQWSDKGDGGGQLRVWDREYWVLLRQVLSTQAQVGQSVVQWREQQTQQTTQQTDANPSEAPSFWVSVHQWHQQGASSLWKTSVIRLIELALFMPALVLLVLLWSFCLSISFFILLYIYCFVSLSLTFLAPTCLAYLYYVSCLNM